MDFSTLPTFPVGTHPSRHGTWSLDAIAVINYYTDRSVQ
jgi:hypothetical protein